MKTFLRLLVFDRFYRQCCFNSHGHLAYVTGMAKGDDESKECFLSYSVLLTFMILAAIDVKKRSFFSLFFRIWYDVNECIQREGKLK